MEFETKEDYNKRIFLDHIKLGKHPPRRGLGNRLLLLSDFPEENCYFSTNFNNVKDIKYKLLQFRRRKQMYGWKWVDNDLLESAHFVNLVKTVEKYLGESFYSSNSRFVNFYYKGEADWYQLDLDFVQKFPQKLKQVRILPKVSQNSGYTLYGN